MSSTYDISNMFEVTGVFVSGAIVYICDTGNNRISRLKLAGLAMLDSYDMAADDRPLAILVQGTRCYVLVSRGTGGITTRVDLWIFNLGALDTAPMTFWKTVTISSLGIFGGGNPPRVGGLYLQYAGSYIIAGCFIGRSLYPTVMDSKVIKLDLDGNIISTTALPSGDLLYGMAIG
ncbi:MAG: hypothetical protein WCJ37_01065 [Syntrophus sp. (in: bacteria)]